MTHHTAAYKSADSQYGLILQQLTRRDGIPAHFSCIWRKTTDRTGQPAEHLLEWFYDTLLPAWEDQRPRACITKAEELLGDKISAMEQTGLIKPGDSFAVFLAMGMECFYAWQGDLDICLLQAGFGKMKIRRLDGITMGHGNNESAGNTGNVGCEENAGSAILEPGAMLVLGNHMFFEAFAREQTAQCFLAGDALDERQLEKYLTEAARKAERDGRTGGDVAVVGFGLAD